MSDLIVVKRDKFHKNWTLSTYEVSGKQFGYGVEDEIREVKVPGETAIPYGRYSLGYRYSPKISSRFYYNDEKNQLIAKTDYDKLKIKKGWRIHDALWVKDVPGFENILIHAGNTDLDSDGCYIVGNKRGTLSGREGVIESVDNYKKLYCKVYKSIKGGNQFINYVMEFNEEKFFKGIRDQGLFSKISQAQVDNMILIKNEFVNKGFSNKHQLAYIFATVYHETQYTMLPVQEEGKGKGLPYGGKLDMGNGPGKRVAYTTPNQLYYGRGHVQLTWRINYKNMGKLIGEDLLNHPELMLVPKISVKVLIEGMMKADSRFGDFTGVSLEQFVNDTKVDFVGARKVINGKDKAETIAKHAKKFYTAII